jgi:hypothetical protein
MTRVLSVVENSIMVSIFDVVPGDILFIRGDERDLIIESVEKREDGAVRYIYKKQEGRYHAPHTIWMDGKLDGGKVFLHDLKRERLEFYGEPHISHTVVVNSAKELR